MIINLNDLTAEEFEYLVLELLETQGFTPETEPSEGKDRGTDFIVNYSSDNPVESISKGYVVQCKRRNHNIKLDEIVQTMRGKAKWIKR